MGDREAAAAVSVLPRCDDGLGQHATPAAQRQIFVNAHPANYQRWLAALVAQARAKPVAEERVVFINAWNEWAEGAYLEPDLQYGRQLLEATRRALDGG